MNTKPLIPLSIFLIGLFVGFVIIIILGLSRRAKNLFQFVLNKFPALDRFYLSVFSYRARPSVIFKAFGLSLISQLLVLWFFILVGNSIEPLPFLSYMFVVPLGMITMSIPIAPAGIGLGQAAYLLFFQWYIGHPTQIGVIAITSFQILALVWSLFGIVFYIRRKKSIHLEEMKA